MKIASLESDKHDSSDYQIDLLEVEPRVAA